MKQTFVLAHAQARSRAMDALALAPEGYRVEIAEPKRSRDQNDAIHAVLTELGNKMGWKWNGYTVDLDDLKSVFMAAYRKTQKQSARILPGVDGEPVFLNWRTSNLTKQEASEFISLIYSHMDNL